MANVRFLIIRFSSIGDIVLTTPVVRALSRQVEGAEIHYLTKPAFAPMLEANPYVHKVHLLQESFSDTMEELKTQHFDYVIDLHKNLRSLRVKNRLKVLSFNFDKLNRQKWLLVNFKRNKMPDLHIVDRYLATTQTFGVKNDGEGLDYFIPENDEVDLKNLGPHLENGFIALVVGAAHETKRLEKEQMVEFCRKVKHPVVLLGGPGDAEEGEEIAKLAGSRHVVNACGAYTINQSASLVKQSNVVVTPDTGMMHIAAAFGKNILSVWGNTVPEFGMYPYQPGEKSEIIEIKGLSCRPCSKIGFERCPEKHFKCIREIDIQSLAEKADRLFSEKPA